jgi:hypothetical protein
MRRTTHVLAATLFWVSVSRAQTAATFPERPTLTPAGTRLMQSPGGLATPVTRTTPPMPTISPTLTASHVEENLTHFDERITELRWQAGHCQLCASGDVIKDFGRRYADARQGLSLIRELHLTERGVIGSPRTIMEYWLSDGRTPDGMSPGTRTLPIDEASLRVEQVKGSWCVRDNNTTFFNFGMHQDEAQQAAAIVQKYHFQRLALIGQGTPVMLVFLGNSLAMHATKMHSPPPPSGRILTQPRQESTSQPFSDAPPNSLQASKLRTSKSLSKTMLPASNDPKSDAMLQGDALAAAALPLSRQLAPPSAPSPDLKTLAERVPMDFRQVHLTHDRDWKLVLGDYVVANFGANEHDARLAEMAFHTSRFTEQCLIGHPKPVFSYFLVNGRPPHELPLGADAIAFRPQDLNVREVNGAWAIYEASRPLFRFGNNSAEAKEALQAIQSQGFDACCRLGQGEQGMTILARTH